MAYATREQVIHWCREMKCDFTGIPFPPPDGWLWSKVGDTGVYVLTALEDEPDICFNDVWPSSQLIQLDLTTRQLIDNVSDDKPDAGTAAREKLMARAARKAKRLLFWTIILSLLALTAGVAGIVYWASQNIHTGYAMVEKQCGIQVGDVTLKGVREYGYRYYEVLGARMNFTRDVKETTVLMPEGSPMMIIGATATEWWGLPVDAGEQRRQLLKPANSYTFVIGKKANVVDYEGFCKPHPIGDDGSEQVAKADTKPTKK